VQRTMIFPRFTVNHVNRASTVMDGLGGKGLNVARVLTVLGEPALLLGFAGGRRGDWMKQELQREGIKFEFVEVSPETRLCTTIIDQERGTITELVEESAQVPDSCYDELFTRIQTLLPTAKALLLSGTITREGPTDFYARCVAGARKAGTTCIVDAQGALLTRAIEQGPDAVKPNKHELERTFGRELRDMEDTWAAMNDLIARGARNVVITNGPDQVLACSPEQRWIITPPQVKTVSPIGSGDSFAAALGAWLARGESIGEACRAGTAAGAANALTLTPGNLDHARFETLLANVKIQKV